MIDIGESIGNAEALTRVFGYWPSFHDAEVYSIALERGGADGPVLEARVHVFEMTQEVDARGYYVLRKHTMATLRFGDVELEELASFNGQNALMGLLVDRLPEPNVESRGFAIHFSPAYGVSARFTCRSVTVVAAEPYAPAT